MFYEKVKKRKVYFYYLLFLSDTLSIEMVEERLQLCDQDTFQCSICYNDIENKKEIFQLETCCCQFCVEVCLN